MAGRLANAERVTTCNGPLAGLSEVWHCQIAQMGPRPQIGTKRAVRVAVVDCSSFGLKAVGLPFGEPGVGITGSALEAASVLPAVSSSPKFESSVPDDKPKPPPPRLSRGIKGLSAERRWRDNSVNAFEEEELGAYLVVV